MSIYTAHGQVLFINIKKSRHLCFFLNNKQKPTILNLTQEEIRLLKYERYTYGDIVVENQKAHMTGGEHVVVDETHKSRERFKETEEGEMND